MNAIASVLCERPEAAEAAFVLSAAVAFADNEIADEENDVLNGFAEKLGISTERAEELLDGLEADGSDMVPALASTRPSSAHVPRGALGLLTKAANASNLRAPLPRWAGGLSGCLPAPTFPHPPRELPKVLRHNGLFYPAVLAHPAPQAVHQREDQQARASPLWHARLPHPRRRLRREGRRCAPRRSRQKVRES